MDAATRAFALLGTIAAEPWAALLTGLPETRWHEHPPRPGDVHELDNQRPRTARNARGSDRIHLICDWLVDGDDAGR